MLAGCAVVESSDRSQSAVQAARVDAADRHAGYLADAIAEHRAARRLTGAALRAAVVEALTYASESDPARRVQVHVVDRWRCTAAEAAAVLASLSLTDWRAIYAARAAWQSAERVPVPVPVVVLGNVGATAGGRLLLAHLDDRARESAGDVPAVPGSGRGRPSADRAAYLIDAVCRHRIAERGSYSAWVRWCAERGMSRAAAARWWARAA